MKAVDALENLGNFRILFSETVDSEILLYPPPSAGGEGGRFKMNAPRSFDARKEFTFSPKVLCSKIPGAYQVRHREPSLRFSAFSLCFEKSLLMAGRLLGCSLLGGSDTEERPAKNSRPLLDVKSFGQSRFSCRGAEFHVEDKSCPSDVWQLS